MTTPYIEIIGTDFGNGVDIGETITLEINTMEKITMKEVRQQLVDLFLEKENYLEELKQSITDVLAHLPEDTPDSKLVALKNLAAKEAKGKFKQLKGEAVAMLELMEELSEGEETEE